MAELSTNSGLADPICKRTKKSGTEKINSIIALSSPPLSPLPSPHIVTDDSGAEFHAD